MLGEGSYGRVETCINMFTDLEYAVKLIAKSDWCFSRAKVLKVGNGVFSHLIPRQNGFSPSRRKPILPRDR